MPSFSPSSESLHHENNQPSVSLSEAFLDSSSRTRDSIPEQYRTHFDELRGEILAFCHEFSIPVETLRSKEAFGVELNSKRIPPERMAQVVSLFARLEYLVTNREPLKEAPPEYLEEAERLYHLREQYTAQVALLEQVGILKNGAITGIDGHEYPVPTLEQIAQRLFEREKDLSVKRDQGFTKLLLVPFGMSLDALFIVFEAFLYNYNHNTSFDLNLGEPFYIGGGDTVYQEADIGDFPKLVYNPQSFDRHTHLGRTKTHILKEQALHPDSVAGWKIHLFQVPHDRILGLRKILREGKGYKEGEENPRPDFETGKSSHEYLSILLEARNDPDNPYHGESGLTPEDWLCAFMTHLTETGEPLDDYDNDEESDCRLIGAVFSSSSAHVPVACWRRLRRQAYLGRNGPNFEIDNSGIRTSVLI